MNKQVRALLGAVVVAVAAWFGYGQLQDGGQGGSLSSAGSSAPVAGSSDFDFSGVYSDAADRIVAAFEAERSDMWIEAGGTVQRVLSDDSEGSRHQRFIVRLPNDHTVLIAHNIDLAQRVPVKQGDLVSFFGEFEWNDRGGVVHWTHHDPRGRKLDYRAGLATGGAYGYLD